MKAEDWKKILIDSPTLWPKTNLVSLEQPHTDARGSIQNIVNFPVKNVSIINSKKGSVRSNHYHKTDWHYMYVLSGSAEYFYRQTDSNEEPKKVIIKQGDLIFTPPLEDHTTVFLEETTLLVMSRNPRDQESYESDVVRVTLVETADIT